MVAESDIKGVDELATPQCCYSTRRSIAVRRKWWTPTKPERSSRGDKCHILDVGVSLMRMKMEMTGVSNPRLTCVNPSHCL